MMLSPNFALSEMLVSQTAARRGIANVPPSEAIDELRRLCALVLQPLRDVVGGPVVVSSGYRSPELNRAVGGAKASCHMAGRAADIVVPGMSVSEVCSEIARLRLPWRQCIDEFGQWVHVSIEPVGQPPRRQMLTARRAANGRTVYAPALF
jgi:zinc D-Ala-D-Ala carboxypeptidase